MDSVLLVSGELLFLLDLQLSEVPSVPHPYSVGQRTGVVGIWGQ